MRERSNVDSSRSKPSALPPTPCRVMAMRTASAAASAAARLKRACTPSCGLTMP